MKKKYRLKALDTLYQGTSSRDTDEREYAIFQMALVLEYSHTPSEDAPDLYAENLDRHLHGLRLSADEERQLVDHLIRLSAEQKRGCASALWALSKANPSVSVGPLLALVSAQGPSMDDAVAYEAVRGLKAALKASGAELRETLLLNDPRPVIAQWATAKDDDLSAAAGKLERLLEDVLAG